MAYPLSSDRVCADTIASPMAPAMAPTHAIVGSSDGAIAFAGALALSRALSRYLSQPAQSVGSAPPVSAAGLTARTISLITLRT
jgi:hypothetical protein